MKEILDLFYNDPNVHIVRARYEDISNSGLISGFRSELIGGKDYHKLTEDIAISVQNFHEGTLTNLIFSDGQVLKLELLDTEITSYYSDYIELRYIIEGTLILSVEHKHVEFSRGTVCFIHPNALHHELIDGSDCTILNINIERRLFNDYFLSRISSSPLEQFLRTSILKEGKKQNYIQFTPRESQNEEIEYYIKTIFAENLGRRAGYSDIIKGYVLRLMNGLSNTYNYSFSETETRQYYQNLFEEISRFMQNNLASVTMEDLAREFHFHPNYFNNLIRKNTGMTYSAYLIQMRINRAKQLLESSDLPIEEIAWLVGYHNKGFFYKRFTEDTGVSPLKYRKNCRNRTSTSRA